MFVRDQPGPLKALTICQPYAALIMTPQGELPAGAYRKRVENRTWSTKVRGEIAIHAGKSLAWLKRGDWPCHLQDLSKAKEADFPGMAFGAIVGLAEIVECYSSIQIIRGHVPDDMRWLMNHVHVSGPYCFVLRNVRCLAVPVPCKGMQGFWSVPEAVATSVRESQMAIEV